MKKRIATLVTVAFMLLMISSTAQANPIFTEYPDTDHIVVEITNAENEDVLITGQCKMKPDGTLYDCKVNDIQPIPEDEDILIKGECKMRPDGTLYDCRLTDAQPIPEE